MMEKHLLKKYDINLSSRRPNHGTLNINLSSINDKWHSFVERFYKQDSEIKNGINVIYQSEEVKFPLLFDKILDLSTKDAMLGFEIFVFKFHGHFQDFFLEVLFQTHLGNFNYIYDSKFNTDILNEFEYSLFQFQESLTIIPNKTAAYLKTLIKLYLNELLSDLFSSKSEINFFNRENRIISPSKIHRYLV
ncbi:hypothetical protein [Bacillus cereus]|uniref:hypothetical protein n=1 Tax=Bacillus cereus TaxID=1396 RepID=UPI0030790B27